VTPRGCAICGKARPALAVAHKDRFCSSSCARVFHHTELNCSGCNCRHDQQTEGCTSCAVRLRLGRKRVRWERQGKQEAVA
jgi:hypothetical protein